MALALAALPGWNCQQIGQVTVHGQDGINLIFKIPLNMWLLHIDIIRRAFNFGPLI